MFPKQYGTKYALVSYQDQNGKSVKYTVPMDDQDAMAKVLRREKLGQCQVRPFVWLYFQKNGPDSIDTENFLISSGSKKLNGCIVVHDSRTYEIHYLHPKLATENVTVELQGEKMKFPLKLTIKKYAKVVFFEVSDVLDDGTMMFVFRDIFIRSVNGRKAKIEESPGNRHAIGKIPDVPLWKIIRKKIESDLKILSA